MTPQPADGPRVLFVSHVGAMSGAEMVLVDAARAFPGSSALLFEAGPLADALEAVGTRTLEPPGTGGLGVVKRDGSLLRALPHVGRIAGIARRIGVAARDHDVVYANSQKAFAISAPACALARRPLLWHLHDIMSPEHFGPGQIKLAANLANRFARAVVVPSQVCADAFVAGGGKPSLVRVVPNGLDDAGMDADAAALRGSFDLPTPFVFGVFSRLAAWKGQDVAIRALARLPDAGCVIAGSAMFGEEAYAESLVALAHSLGVADRVRFLGRRDDVPALMRAVDAVAHTSTKAEPFGRTLVEAMLAGTPLVASDAGAAAEILDGGRCGTLVPPGDFEGLAIALWTIQSGRNRRAALEDARLRAQAVYGADAMRAGLRQAVRDAMAPRQARAASQAMAAAG